MGAPPGRRLTRPRIRRRLRVIALGLVLLPTLAVVILMDAASEMEDQQKHREIEKSRHRVREGASRLASELGEQAGTVAVPREHYTLLAGAAPLALSEDVQVDGDCSDWRSSDLSGPSPCQGGLVRFDRVELLEGAAEQLDPSDFSFDVMAGTRKRYLHLFIRVSDDDLRLRSRELDRRDHLRLVVAAPGSRGVSRREPFESGAGASLGAVTPPAPSRARVPVRFVTTFEPSPGGEVTTYQVEPGWRREVAAERRLAWGDYLGPAYRRPYGVWRPVPGGYQLELRLPERSFGAAWQELELGLAVVDVDRSPEDPGGVRRQAIWVGPQVEGAFALEAPGAERLRDLWEDLDLVSRRVAIFDARRRELFSSASFPRPVSDPLGRRASGLLDRLVQGEASPVVDPEGVLAAARIVSERSQATGFVLEQGATAAPRQSLAASVRESPVTAVVLVGALLLLFLSLWYTRRLSRRILALVDDVGADRDADDEVGELSRQLSDLVERVRADRDYLERLPSIIGHETLGPLSVVRMFLADLEAGDGVGREGRRHAAERAIHSIEELIEDLREATSLEEALARGERVEVDLVGLLASYLRGYREEGPAELEADLPEGSFRTRVIENRIEQMLDKLLGNAAEFSDGSPVRIGLECGDSEARIRVENRGSQLPPGPGAEQIFEPMWSDRKRTAERHLGMGLYVARVIAEHHGGAIRAWNADVDRVVFEVTLRAARERAPAVAEVAP